MSDYASPASPPEALPEAAAPVSPSGPAPDKAKEGKRKEKKKTGEKEKRKKKSKKLVDGEASLPDQLEGGQERESADADQRSSLANRPDPPGGASLAADPVAPEPVDAGPAGGVDSDSESASESDGVPSGDRPQAAPPSPPVTTKDIHEGFSELAISPPEQTNSTGPDPHSSKRTSRHTVRTSVGNGYAGNDPAGGPSLPPSASVITNVAAPNAELPTHAGQDGSEPTSPTEVRIVDLDAGRAVSWREIPTAPPPLPPREAVSGGSEGSLPGPGERGERGEPSESGEPARFWPGVSLAHVSAGASSLTSGLGRSLAAGIAAVRRPQEQQVEKVRLPRREVDEEAVARDVLRFVEAKDVLLSSGRGAEELRALGVQLEEAWREKLSDSQTLRTQVEETADVLVDLEDENEHLRDQLALLSEQIVSRDEALEACQRTEVLRHEKERQTWQSTLRVEKEDAQVAISHARRLLCEERAATAQLRLVLHALKSGGLAVDVLDSVDVGLEAELEVGETVLDAPEEGGAEADMLADGARAMPLKAMHDAGLVPGGAGADGEAGTACGGLFDKAAADAALLRALQEENASLRAHQAARERKYGVLQQELAAHRRALAGAEEALDEPAGAGP